jgi:restriction endonuclease S subunit
MLIENGLLAVISLPPGVFNPYSGVKTSILIIDKSLAKKAKEILFVKISNDGYDLGAQRRPIDKNDLPQALEIIKSYQQALKEGKEFILDDTQKQIAHLVTKEKIAESGDYNLSGERYKEVVSFANQKWPMIKLGEVCEIYQPKTITSKEIKQTGKYKVFGANGVIGFYDDYNHEDAEVLITCRGATCGTVNMSEPKSWITGNAMVVKPKDNLDKKFLFYFLRNTNLNSVISGSAQPQITRVSLSPFKIPLPPLEVQKEIVERIEVKEKIIEAAKAVIENLEKNRKYFGEKIKKMKDVEWVELGEVLDYEQPTKYIVKSVNYSDKYKTPVLTAGQSFILGYTNENEGIFPKEKLPVIIFDDFTTAIKFVDFPFKVKSSAMKILHTRKDKADIKFLFYTILNIKFNHDTHKRYWISEYSKIKIPLPSLSVQKQLVAEMEKQEKIIEANKKLSEMMKKEIGEIISEV